jgi:hypothetical protein
MFLQQLPTWDAYLSWKYRCWRVCQTYLKVACRGNDLKTISKPYPLPIISSMDMKAFLALPTL